MKKLCITLLSLAGFAAHAQITVTRADFGVAGDVLYYAEDSTLTGFSAGNAGADITWDFSAAVSPDLIDSSVFVDPQNVEDAPPEANIGITQGMGTQFFNISNTDVKMVIEMEGSGLPNTLIKIAEFPMNFGDVVKDSMQTSVSGSAEDFGFSDGTFDSIRVNLTIRSMSTVDGWGTLKTPVESVSALRIKNESNVTALLEGKVPFLGWTPLPFNINQTQSAYGWYANNRNYFLAEATLDSNNNVTSFRYQLPQGTTTGLKTASKGIRNMYPNPANDMVNLELNGSYKEQVSVIITDITGKTVSTESISLDGSVATIPTAALSNGIYMVHLSSASISHTVKIAVRH
jgi:hypothetical protein